MDDLQDVMIRSISAMYAGQDRPAPAQPRRNGLEASMAEWSAIRARAEARYGPVEVLRERMMARTGMSAQIMSRASWNVWPAGQ